jgi:hypothetical protein
LTGAGSAATAIAAAIVKLPRPPEAMKVDPATLSEEQLALCERALTILNGEPDMSTRTRNLPSAAGGMAGAALSHDCGALEGGQGRRRAQSVPAHVDCEQLEQRREQSLGDLTEFPSISDRVPEP